VEFKMNKDQVKGAVNDAAGRAKRQAGEWTGNRDTQAEGAAQQLKGKFQKTVGDLKEAARKAREEVRREQENNSDDSYLTDEHDRAREDTIVTRNRR
jgi:uncharacterized protein YjbJ (UPF0337 family)